MERTIVPTAQLIGNKKKNCSDFNFLMKNIRSERIYSLACNVDSLLRYGIYSVVIKGYTKNEELSASGFYINMFTHIEPDELGCFIIL
jgi:hypothetical protein